MILKRLGANRWIPLIVFCWGITTTMTGLVQNFGDLVAVRMILGLCEGGLLPGIVSKLGRDLYLRLSNLLSQILYLSTIYKRHELQLR